MSSSRNHSRKRGSRSQPRNSRNSSVASIPYLPQLESLILADGAAGEERTDLLQDFVYPYHHTERTPVNEEEEEPTSDDIDDERAARANLPWWKRPSSLWLIMAVPFASISMSATLAPRIEIYTILACSVHKPEYARDLGLSKQLGLPYFEDGSDLLASKPLPVAGTAPLVPINIAPDWEDTRIYFTGLPDATNDTEADKKGFDRCASDPEVQAAVAQLTAREIAFKVPLMTASMGILSCLTTAWWGSYSDRHGRTRVMLVSVVGILLTDFNFIFVSLFSRKLPGGYWFLVVGPVIEGCLGGITSGMAVMHAYVSDTTDPSTRSRAFSLFLGLMFMGVALGPTLGGLLIRVTHNVLSVFYMAAILHLIYATFTLIIPESLSRPEMIASRVRHREQLRGLKEAREGVAVGLLVRIKRLFGFLSPLTIFMPANIKGENALKSHKRDWNLTLVAAAYGLTIMIMGSIPYKLQYASATFHWSSEILGYFLSMVGAARAVYLAVILPVVIKFLKPKPPPVQSSADAGPSQPQSSPPKDRHSPSFDLNLARVSLVSEVINYTVMALAPTPIPFLVFSLIGSLGTGFSPAVQSVALELYSRRGEKENGRLFGALSVLQALSSQIIGPAVFGFTYIRSVAVLPPAIFYLSSGMALVSLVFLSFVRLPKETLEEVIDDVEDQAVSALPTAREETLVDLEPELPEADVGRNPQSNPADSSLVDV